MMDFIKSIKQLKKIHFVFLHVVIHLYRSSRKLKKDLVGRAFLKLIVAQGWPHSKYNIII